MHSPPQQGHRRNKARAASLYRCGWPAADANSSVLSGIAKGRPVWRCQKRLSMAEEDSAMLIVTVQASDIQPRIGSRRAYPCSERRD